MAVATESGFLALADITGYTAYLTGSEIEHAPVIAGDLLETVVGRLDPPLRLAKLEGDAAFLFTEDGRAEPALLLGALEAAYHAFRRRLRSIETATTCDCRSCALAPRLDLKLFLHHGSYVHTRVAGRDELAGQDVIVAHRLLKGSTRAAAGGRGFALLTSTAVKALGIEPAGLGLTSVQESMADIGQLDAYLLDLEARWQAEGDVRRVGGIDSQPIVRLEATLPTEPATAWAYLTSPALRAQWEGPISFEESAAGGMRGVGTITRCISGRLASIEEVVDWQPYDHVGWRTARPGIGPLEAAADLAPEHDATRVELRWCLPAGGAAPTTAIEALRIEKSAALDRLVERMAGQSRQVE